MQVTAKKLDPDQMLYHDADTGQMLMLIRGINGQYAVATAEQELQAQQQVVDRALQLAGQSDLEQDAIAALVAEHDAGQMPNWDDWDGFWREAAPAEAAPAH